MKTEIDSIKFTDDYIQDIKQILQAAQKQSYKTVNSIMIQAYWLIGYRIVEQEQHGKERANYGEKIIENLSKALNSQLGSGMSEAHLKNCRQFYLTFPSKSIRYTVCSQLSWSHLRLIMRLDTEKERNYYIEVKKNKTENQIVLYKDENGKTNISVRFSDEDVWVTQKQLAEIYQTTQQNISLHVDNIYKDNELPKGSTHKDFLL